MTHVKDYYQWIQQEHNTEIASKFLQLMSEWDGESKASVYEAFYDENVLSMKFKEAKDSF